MSKTIERELLALLVAQLRMELISSNPKSAVANLEMIEKVAGAEYREWLMTQEIDDVIRRDQYWTSRRS